MRTKVAPCRGMSRQPIGAHFSFAWITKLKRIFLADFYLKRKIIRQVTSTRSCESMNKIVVSSFAHETTETNESKSEWTIVIEHLANRGTAVAWKPMIQHKVRDWHMHGDLSSVPGHTCITHLTCASQTGLRLPSRRILCTQELISKCQVNILTCCHAM